MAGISRESFNLNKVQGKLGNQPIYFISLKDLITNKKQVAEHKIKLTQNYWRSILIMKNCSLLLKWL